VVDILQMWTEAIVYVWKQLVKRYVGSKKLDLTDALEDKVEGREDLAHDSAKSLDINSSGKRTKAAPAV
jgi:hypothetical protein